MLKLTSCLVFLVTLLPFAMTGLSAQSKGKQKHDKLRQALNDDVSSAWIYEDIRSGYATARKTGKPLLVTFR